jgi:dCMP deaminase
MKDFNELDEIGRPTWDSLWMGFAFALSERSTDPRMKCGAVIVSSDNTQVLSLGYNGSWKGGPNHVASMEPGASQFIHAEENAIIKLNYSNPAHKKLYITHSPCLMCAKRIINANIDEVIFANEYRLRDGLELLRNAGVPIRQYAGKM